VYDAGSATTQQITTTTTSSSADPLISEDGQWVYFVSSAQFFGSFEPGNYYRVNLGNGAIERAGGPCFLGSFNLDTNAYHAIDGDGSRGVFVSSCDLFGINLDGSSEVYFVDRDTPATIRPGKEAPTVVKWDFEPHAVRYDVIRGDVANLGIDGVDIGLGPVFCLENDSLDTNTIGSADVQEPAIGQAFFYLYRGTQGVLDGPGSWGRGSGGQERVAGPGDCSP